jgi:hypothetical protein
MNISRLTLGSFRFYLKECFSALSQMIYFHLKCFYGKNSVDLKTKQYWGVPRGIVLITH